MNSIATQGVISRQSTALLRIIAGLLVLAGIVDGKPVERMAWETYQAILRILRPAESAVRRLIAIAAQDLPIKLRTKAPPVRSSRNRTSAPAGTNQADGKKRRYMFSLFDPRRPEGETSKRKKRGPIPRIWTIDAFIAHKRPHIPRGGPSADGTVGAKGLSRRLLAIVQALEDIPRHAKRYAAFRNIPVEDRPPNRINMLRPGRAPWLPKKSTHEVHDILRDCHFFAKSPLPKEPQRETLQQADTS